MCKGKLLTRLICIGARVLDAAWESLDPTRARAIAFDIGQVAFWWKVGCTGFLRQDFIRFRIKRTSLFVVQGQEQKEEEVSLTAQSGKSPKPVCPSATAARARRHVWMYPFILEGFLSSFCLIDCWSTDWLIWIEKMKTGSIVCGLETTTTRSTRVREINWRWKEGATGKPFLSLVETSTFFSFGFASARCYSTFEH